MYNVTQNFLNAIKQNGRTFKSSITIRDTTFDDNNIIDMTLEENVNPADSFMLGAVASNKLEVTLIDVPSTLILENAVVTPKVSLLVGDVYEEIPLGIFTVDEISKDKNTKLVCYDNMIRLEKAFFSDLSYPASINSVAQEICGKAGVQLATTLPNTLINKIEGYSYREAISFIASFLGAFTRFNRLGKLEVVSYGTTNIEVTGDNYFKLTTNEKSFTIGRLACKVGENIITAGTNGNEIQFENPIMTKEQLNIIYDILKTFNYMPYNMDWQGNHALQAGDKIAITDTKGNTYNTLIMQQKLSYKGGLSANAVAVGKTEQAQEFSSSGSMKNKVDRIVIEQANIKLALMDKATIEDLTATSIKVNNIVGDVGAIQNLLTGNLSAKNMQTGFITAESGLIANGAISDAMIQNLSVSKILAGDISTSNFRIVSANGNMLISDNTIQIKDVSRIRVQIGKDASNDYNMYVWDSAGNLMFDATGLKASGIKDKIIHDDMVSDTANINGGKIEKESLVTQINGATTLLKASKIKLDTENQTLDVAFTSLKSSVTSQENTVTSQGTSISAIQGQITTKIWQQDITTAVDNVQIGGRNYFRKDTRINYGNGLTFDRNNSECPYGFYAVGDHDADNWLRISDVIKSNGSWTVSWEMRGSQNCPVGVAVDICDINHTRFYTTSDNTWKRYSLTANVTNYADGSAYNFVDFENFAWAYFYVRNIKVEQGNKPTDWTPAPEDVDTQLTTINTNYSNLNQAVGSISANVSSLQTNTNNLGTRMTTAEASITANTNAINLKATQSSLDTTNNNLSSVTNRLSTAEGSINIQAGQIENKVNVNGVISAINQTAESIKIQASKIDLTGLVTITNLSTPGSVIINGGNIKGGTLTLGGVSNGNGIEKIKDANGNDLITIDNSGILMSNGAFQIQNNVALGWFADGSLTSTQQRAKMTVDGLSTFKGRANDSQTTGYLIFDQTALDGTGLETHFFMGSRSPSYWGGEKSFLVKVPTSGDYINLGRNQSQQINTTIGLIYSTNGLRIDASRISLDGNTIQGDINNPAIEIDATAKLWFRRGFFLNYGGFSNQSSDGSFNFVIDNNNRWVLDKRSMSLYKYVNGTWTAISS